MNIIIGNAWPYANGPLHLGRIAVLLPGDILARYHRMMGDEVIFLSGTDCHGTPVTIKAKEEGIMPIQAVKKYHAEFQKCFKSLGFSFDIFEKTHSKFHEEKVKEFILELYNKGYIYEKNVEQAYCEKCQNFLQDRDIKLICPECGEETKGDQCDKCLHVPTTEELLEGNCIVCGSKLVKRNNKVLYLKLSAFQKEIEEHTKEVEHSWRINARNETWKYLKQGLKDRAVTRDLNWGIEIPLPGYEDKRMYVWIDAVLGYLTDTMKLCEEKGLDWQEFWKEGNNNKIYTIVSAEYLNFNDQKFSKSKGIGITALEACNLYDSDSIRYHLISNGPERKDTNFTIEDFKTVHNTEILNKFGNLVNRTLNFKDLEEIPEGKIDNEIENLIKETYKKAGENIENLEFKAAVQNIMDLVEAGNKYYDANKPWVAKKENIEEFNNIIYTCSVIIANLSNLFEPIMPEASQKIRDYLEIKNKEWNYITIPVRLKLEKIEPLFERIK